MSRGIRCADTTSASCGTPNSASTVTAASITGQSESLPMTTLTSGRLAIRGSPIPLIRPAPPGPAGLPAALFLLGSGTQVTGGSPGPVAQRADVAAEHRDVADFPAGPDRLAVQMHFHPRIAGQHVQQPRVHVRILAAAHGDHHRALRGQPARA